MLLDASCVGRGCAVGEGIGKPRLVSLQTAKPWLALTPSVIQGSRYFRSVRKADHGGKDILHDRASHQLPSGSTCRGS